MDARALNWEHIVPPLTGAVLYLPLEDEGRTATVAPPRTPEWIDAISPQAYDGVVAPDLGPWAALCSRPTTDVLRTLSDAVVPGGWLCVGFANRTHPLSAGRRGAVLPSRAKETLRRHGFRVESYAPVPDQRCPAYLLALDGPEAIRFFLDNLFFPYATEAGWLRRRVRLAATAVMAAVARCMPHRMRQLLAPGTILVARRGPC